MMQEPLADWVELNTGISLARAAFFCVSMHSSQTLRLVEQNEPVICTSVIIKLQCIWLPAVRLSPLPYCSIFRGRTCQKLTML